MRGVAGKAVSVSTNGATIFGFEDAHFVLRGSLQRMPCGDTLTISFLMLISSGFSAALPPLHSFSSKPSSDSPWSSFRRLVLLGFEGGGVVAREEVLSLDMVRSVRAVLRRTGSCVQETDFIGTN